MHSAEMKSFHDLEIGRVRKSHTEMHDQGAEIKGFRRQCRGYSAEVFKNQGILRRGKNI
jgi:hypothetical protein